MSETQSGAILQACPSCGAMIDTTAAEPLARVACPKCGESFRVERVFDTFELVETLGVGGMGTVYKARDTDLDRFVALKILRKDAGAGHTAELQREARVTASVNHPNVVKVFLSGRDHGQFYLVMELVDHGSLEHFIEQEKAISEAHVLETGIQVAKGLRAAHELGLIHRDVKPANILFADAHTAKIVDFGLAGAAETGAGKEGAIWGTPYYVAPERLNNEPEDFRSDIYSLGATLFHALAGRPPIEGETNAASKLRELKNKPIDLRSVAPAASRGGARVIQRMLAPDPVARFQSYDEMISALEKAAGKGASRLWRIVVPTALLIVAALFGILFFTMNMSRRNEIASFRVTTPDGALVRQYDALRHRLIAGEDEAASRGFSRLLRQAGNQQPLLNWIRLHKELAASLAAHPRPARESFQAVAKDGLYSTAPKEASLARFFVETAGKMATNGAISASKPKQNSDSVYAFGLLLFAVKDLEQRDFPDATAWLEQFAAAQPAPPFTWINDYKPLAQKYLDDLRVYNAWSEQTKAAANPAEAKTALDNLRGIEARLQTRGPLADRIRTEAAQLESQISKNHGVQREEPARPAESGSIATQDNAARRARWLAAWKNQLIQDLNHTHFTGAITDKMHLPYEGVISASSAQLVLKNPYGTTAITWDKLSPQTLLAISTSFIRSGTSDAAEREWLCAVFASENGLVEDASRLGHAAAAGKPDYQALLPFLAR